MLFLCCIFFVPLLFQASWHRTPASHPHLGVSPHKRRKGVHWVHQVRQGWSITGNLSTSEFELFFGRYFIKLKYHAISYEKICFYNLDEMGKWVILNGANSSRAMIQEHESSSDGERKARFSQSEMDKTFIFWMVDVGENHFGILGSWRTRRWGPAKVRQTHPSALFQVAPSLGHWAITQRWPQ